MGSILSAINDDINHYLFLCRHYKEEIRHTPDAYGNSLEDCYGRHAKKLQKRWNKEREEKKTK